MLFRKSVADQYKGWAPVNTEKKMEAIKVFQNGKKIWDGFGTHTMPMRNIGDNVQDRWVEFSITNIENEIFCFEGFDLTIVSKQRVK